ncbi:hydroxymethylbilane synthase [Microaceticoccus formicicus]|uniref:hydroxymethylbilane synthase n=1 Tax=Microaceticoccus formicicus TaxID=3118105 RepID=UPI003CD04786|nr:hydroxymethylbilane synthase [Peptoniphilaceae bacterium AMB_02]
MKKRIVIGTRGSNLAVSQTNTVKEMILNHYPDYEVEIEIIKTLGDLRRDVALDALDRKGIFTKEIEDKLMDGSIDIAVHSMKDMPSEVNSSLHFPITLKREDPSDVLVMKDGITLEDIRGANLKIGTGSKRRILLSRLFLGANPTVPIRGNVETRIRKIYDMELGGVILAKAGINRLKLSSLNEYILPKDEFLPAPCQGILAIQTLKSNREINEILKPLNHDETYFEMTVEREFMRTLGGGCHSPMGISILKDGESYTVKGLFGTEDLDNYIIESIKTNRENAVADSILLAEKLKEKIREVK